jgi:hypothetical protein
MTRPELTARLERAKRRLDQSETDAEFEANRQIVIWLEALLAERSAA